MRLSDVRRRDVQDFADRLYADGLDPSTIKNALNPLQVIFAEPSTAMRWRLTRRRGSNCPPCVGAVIGSHRPRRLSRSSPHSPRTIVPFG
jgi:hypothetical protein